MRCVHPSLIVLCFALAACQGDRTITRGADGAGEWDRRLWAAVPVGTPEHDATVTMERNGFRCRALPDLPSTVWCDKMSGGNLDSVKRRWQATFTVKDGRVVAVIAFTGLIGP
jgi:hypothetical protein